MALDLDLDRQVAAYVAKDTQFGDYSYEVDMDNIAKIFICNERYGGKISSVHPPSARRIYVWTCMDDVRRPPSAARRRR